MENHSKVSRAAAHEALEASIPHDASRVQGDALSSGTDLPFERIGNLRDLGGLSAVDGQTIQKGRLFRSANPGLASPADIARLQTFGLDVVVDFRTPEERSADEAPFAAAFVWLLEPVLGGNLSPVQLLPILKHSTPQDTEAMMTGFYRELPVAYQAQFKALLTLGEQNRTLLYHCTAGKDRTGFATALLLSALGVAREAIFEDYLKSNRSNAATDSVMGERVAAAGLDPAVVQRLLSVQADYLQAALDVIDAQYGGIERYLRDTLQADVAALRRNYLM
ncbi:tyrosine-protein phosphatase [Paraburkholderia hayleyella]|uniref:tyrosine-protein phosphatase n=1 Tax=Paraburkholderia hayleyella TaxID=2152889 RepID=UPI001FE977F5|nr:tyrosine-protein phosphatase [Paraburkholderia hayleyella]